MNEGNFALQLQLRLVAFGLLLIITGPSSICGNAAIITSVNYAFETFSPYALIRFFEFSDREWNITQTCFRDMYVYVQGLRNGEYWAVKLYDATSYYAGAAFSGTTVRLHNPNLCRFLSQQHNDIQLQYTNPNYKLFALPFDVHLISGHFLMEVGYDNYFRDSKNFIVFDLNFNCYAKGFSTPPQQKAGLASVMLPGILSDDASLLAKRSEEVKMLGSSKIIFDLKKGANYNSLHANAYSNPMAAGCTNRNDPMEPSSAKATASVNNTLLQ
uniref:Nose resistant-to-fluoxetine protein N-terminal domain-containing protein n=1 Tax=Stomoxys calcitrans TaxID=35570 RepID=A0A1I8NMU5_STOCA